MLNAVYSAHWANNKGENKMRKIILSQAGCTKCKSLSSLYPEAEVVELPVDKLLMLARELNIKSLPIVVLTGETQDLLKILQ